MPLNGGVFSLGRLDDDRRKRRTKSFSESEYGRKSGANYKTDKNKLINEKKTKLDKEKILTKKQIKEAEKNGEPLWLKYPDKYKKQDVFWIRALKSVGGFLATFLLIVGIIGVIGVGVAATVIYSYSNPELLTQLEDIDVDMSSTIYVKDKNGNYVAYETLYSPENRTWVSISDMPQFLKDATVAIEDKRFYTHLGVDPIRTTKSVIDYALAKLTHKNTDGLQGGSTLTQQLIKNISGDNEQTSDRKIREMLNALYIERNFSKEQILEYYLNTVDFSDGYYGAATAAKYYFGKDVSELSIVECAALISITKSPTYYNPYNNPEKNKERRNDVLYEMFDQGYITQDEYNEAVNSDLVLRDRNVEQDQTKNSSDWSYATDTIFEAVVADLMSTYGWTRSYAVNKMYTGGYSIYSTIDLEIQTTMENYFEDEKNYSSDRAFDEATQTYVYPQIAMEVLDPETGEIVGVIGGRGKKTGVLSWNRATQAVRQPGSSIKPITAYGYALDQGIITPGTPIDDYPVSVYNNEPWPTNFVKGYNGLTSLRESLKKSLNAPAAQLVQKIGVSTSFNFAKYTLGLKSLIDGTDKDEQLSPLAVGGTTYGVTLQEMVGAFTAFANGGVYTPPRAYSKVVSYSGNTVLEKTKNSQIVFTPETAWQITDILQDAIKYTAGNKIPVENVATAGKTGTTTSYKDRWLIGYTPYYLAGIWYGYDDKYTVSANSVWQAYPWSAIMNKIHAIKGKTSGKFEQPDGMVQVTYCVDSGKLPTEICNKDPRGNRTATAYFRAGTEPTEKCDCHHYEYVCSTSGCIAHQNCPSAYQAVFVDYVRSLPAKVVTSDAAYICPKLTSDLILYKDKYLPAYTNMLPSGTYPAIASYAGARNTLCTVHDPGSKPRKYGR